MSKAQNSVLVFADEERLHSDTRDRAQAEWRTRLL